MIAAGLQLMVLGMTIVFVFLILLVMLMEYHVQPCPEV